MEKRRRQLGVQNPKPSEGEDIEVDKILDMKQVDDLPVGQPFSRQYLEKFKRQRDLE